ncbi:DUF6076 domain-containing protein [Agathobaculum sp. NTUH-O15-33]|uniref:DUF6076 domain-containing protein n=1 Tax=Agathobaculum sp. NTUH-O15-33 TaxID=3079302 RepID=UPI002958999C|nr:DUF6076 domain-containing protein [Agathobaculum sp. NTUH-O15-33]WNX84069.1 DUF6076 domain-containing protein [Agathobaculum sp. NTUH-O15-33]
MQIGYVHVLASKELLLNLLPDFQLLREPIQVVFAPGASLLEYAYMDAEGLRAIFDSMTMEECTFSHSDELQAWIDASAHIHAKLNVYLFLFAQTVRAAQQYEDFYAALNYLRNVLPDAKVFHAELTIPSDWKLWIGRIVLDAMLTAQRRLREDLDKLFEASREQYPNNTCLQRYYLLGTSELHHCAPPGGFAFTVQPDKLLAGRDKDEQAEALSAGQTHLLPAYALTRVTDLIAFDIFMLAMSNSVVKRCLHCGRWFSPRGRSDTEYCDRFTESGKRCSEIGATLRFEALHKDDEIQQLYLKAYRRMDSRKRQLKHLAPKVKNWGKEARAMRRKCYNGEITVESFRHWLDETTQRT